MRFSKKLSCLFLIGILFSCSKDVDPTEPMVDMEMPEPTATLTVKEQEFLSEYEFITFNLSPTSFGASRNEKWETDIKLFLQGDVSDTYRAEVVNALATFTDFFDSNLKCSLVDTFEESNVHLIFGEKDDIKELWPDMFNQIGETNFEGYALYKSAGGFKIHDGRIWVRNEKIPLFKHELCHVIGLGHASGRYCSGSIASNRSLMCSFLLEDFSAFDRAIIQTLYTSEVEAGKFFSELKPVIEELLLSDAILVE